MEGSWVPAACRSLSWRFLVLVTGVPLLLTALIDMSLVGAAFLNIMPLLAVWVVLVGVPWSLVVASATFGSYVERMEVRTGLRLVMNWSGIARYLTARRPVLLLVGENVIPGAPARRR